MITIKSAVIACSLLLLISCSSQKKPNESSSANSVAAPANHTKGISSSYAVDIPVQLQPKEIATAPPAAEPDSEAIPKTHRLFHVRSRGTGNGGVDPFREDRVAARREKAQEPHSTTLTSGKAEMDSAGKNQLWKNKASVLFTVDTAMILEENYDVFLSIYTDPEDSSEALKFEDTRGHTVKNPPARIADSVREHTDYRVTLHGNDFQIANVTDSIQHLYPHAVTTWKWEVSPTSKDAEELTVVIAGFDNEFKVRKDNFFTRRVIIHVTPMQKIREIAASQYAYAAYTGMLGAIGWFWQNRRKKRKQKDAATP